MCLLKVFPRKEPPNFDVIHYNVFGTDTIYYGRPGGWINKPATRNDFYQWASGEYDKNPNVIVQFNHPSNNGKGTNQFSTDEAKDCRRDPVKLLEVFSVGAEGADADKEWLGGYKIALSKGWKVGPTATSDNHDGIDALKNVYKKIRTVVATTDASRDSILAALGQPVAIPDGWTVVMYENSDFTGAGWVLNSYNPKAVDFTTLIDAVTGKCAAAQVSPVWIYNPNGEQGYSKIVNKNSNLPMGVIQGKTGEF